MAIAIFCFVDLPSNRLSLSLTVSYLALHVFNLLYDSFSVSFISCYLKDTGTVLTHSPLTAATRGRYPASACEMVMWSPSQTGVFPPGTPVSSHTKTIRTQTSVPTSMMFRNRCKINKV